MSKTRQEILDELAVLSFEQRLHFFELLAHNITVSTRTAYVAKIDIEKRIEAFIVFNECQHRVTARIWEHRLNTYVWTDEDFLDLIIDSDNRLPEGLRGYIGTALNSSLKYVNNNP